MTDRFDVPQNADMRLGHSAPHGHHAQGLEPSAPHEESPRVGWNGGSDDTVLPSRVQALATAVNYRTSLFRR